MASPAAARTAGGLSLEGRAGTAILVALATGATALWAVTLPAVDPARMTDLGLVSVMPARMLVALAVLTLSLGLTLTRRRVTPWLALLHIVLIVIVLYGLPALVEEVPRHRVAWRHAGIADYIARNGRVDGTIDAYFNWPGFFVLTAFLTETMGLRSALSFADWAPVFFNLLYLGPLLLIFGAVTRDRRVVWTAVAVFYLGNWIGQDYLSPQALTYFAFLVIVAVLLRWFPAVPDPEAPRRLRLNRLALPVRVRAWLGPPSTTSAVRPEGSSRQRVALVLIVVALFAATVPSHQLTPFMVIAGVGALVVARRCSTRSLPVVMGVLVSAWVAFMTVAYLSGHLETMLDEIGDVETAATENVSERLQGSAEHALVVRLRLLLTAALWSLAVLGALRLRRRGGHDSRFALLALAPFVMLAVQPYGGEMLLRVYLFVLPFVAFFLATLAVEGRPQSLGWRSTAALGAASLTLLAGFLIARYGNERSDVFTAAEVTAVERLYEIAPPGSTLVAGSRNLPWRAQDYERYEYELVSDLPSWENMPPTGPRMREVLSDLTEVMREAPGGRAYLITTQSQRAYVNLLGPAPRGSLDRLEQTVVASGAFTPVYSGGGARIWRLKRGSGKKR